MMERRSFLARIAGVAAIATLAPDRLLAATPKATPLATPVPLPPAPPSDIWAVLRDAHRSGDAIWIRDGLSDNPIRAQVTEFTATWDDSGGYADATIRAVDSDPHGFAREWSVGGRLLKERP